jgi:hypothetical protein
MKLNSQFQRPCSVPIVLVFFAFFVACGAECLLAEPQSPSQRDSRPTARPHLRFFDSVHGIEPQSDVGGHSEFSTRLVGGSLVAHLRVSDVWRPDERNGDVYYYDLTQTEVVALCGRLSRVSAITHSELTMELVEAKEGPLASLPSVRAYAVPENATQVLWVVDFGAVPAQLRVSKITVQPDGDSPPTAEVRGSYYLRRKGAPAQLDSYREYLLEPRIVREGDLLPVRDAAVKVLRIVPPDPETKLRGWVEFDTKPVKPAQGRHPDDKD